MKESKKPFFEDKKELLEEILGRYPDYGKRSAIMPLLRAVQDAERHVSEERVKEIAEILDLGPTAVKGVMSFYSTYHEVPVGKFHIQVCSTLSCSLAGSDEMYDYLVEELGIVNGETDEDGLFSIQKVECLGSCTTAPVLQINDDYYENVGQHRCHHLVESMRQGKLEKPWRERHGDNEGAEKAKPLQTTAKKEVS